MDEITVVGGGLAGLIAASEVAEAGVPVRLMEARQRLGGRAQSLEGDYQANFGPHALYAGTEIWGWLKERGLHSPSRMPVRSTTAIQIRWQGDLRRLPPLGALRNLRRLTKDAPVERPLGDWAAERAGEDTARFVAGLAGPLVFDHDPGRLSAASVMGKIRSVQLQLVPTPRYVEGGWGALVERIAAHARSTGVVIEVGRRVESVDEVAGSGPVIVALDPPGARNLLGDESLRPESPRVALLDLGLESRRGDPYLVVDMDEAAFVDRFTAVVPSLAPPGHELVQASVGLRPDEGLASGVSRLEAILDQAFTGWRERTTWRRRGLGAEATGAVDLPGTTWQDRTPVAYADDVWLAGDWVAAPGHLAEVSCTSAQQAAAEAVLAFRGPDRVGHRPLVNNG